MKNAEIIMKAKKKAGFFSNIEVHTAAIWKKNGYEVKPDALDKPAFECEIWQPGSRGESGKRFHKESAAFYAPFQVEKIGTAGGMESTLKALGNIPGITFLVKGAKTAAPVIWISGETAKHESEITALGGRWAAKKSAWYIKPETKPEPVPALVCEYSDCDCDGDLF